MRGAGNKWTLTLSSRAFRQAVCGCRSPHAAPPGRAPETMDALFHLPLLALAVMVIARRKPSGPSALGRNVAMLLVEHFRRCAARRWIGDVAHVDAADAPMPWLFSRRRDSRRYRKIRRRVITLTTAGKSSP